VLLNEEADLHFTEKIFS